MPIISTRHIAILCREHIQTPYKILKIGTWTFLIKFGIPLDYNFSYIFLLFLCQKYVYPKVI
jgi:hypothetical protein